MLQLIFLIIFPFAVWKAWKNVQLAKVSTGWPTTTGRITAAETVKVLFRRQPRVTYSYAVNGAPFTSQRISFAGGYKPKETDAILARYPVGKEVPVSYAPENPGEATLETGATKEVRAPLNILLIFFVVIIVLNVVTYYVKGLDKKSGPPIRTYGAAGMIARP
ncbi:MAG: DUF3592 domain-containing protein, partial [Verrucomicrobiaceae bacterium]|nr:DUF3592 domain-containing protein [Verrucomicrobiaceae bacterium]